MNEITKIMINTSYGRPTGQYSLDDSNKVIRAYFEAELGIPEGCKDIKTIRKVLRHPEKKVRLYEIIEETVENLLVSGWRDNEFFNRFVEFRNLQLGEQNLFYVEDDSILSVSEIADGNNELRRQKLGAGTEYTVKTKTYGIKIYDEFIRFQAGIVDWAVFTNKMYEAIDKATNDQIFAAFMGLDDIVPESFGYTGTLTLEKVVEIAEAVSIATGEEVIIAGIRASISKLMGLTPSGWISGDMANQRSTTGYTTHFEGIETLVIPNSFEKGTTTPKYEANKLYILPKTDAKPIKFVYEGDMEYAEDTERLSRRDQTVEAMITYKAGLATVFNKHFGVITYTA